MGYAFLWLEAMAAVLLMVAVVFACSGRLKKWPALWPILMALLLVVPAIAATVFAGFLFHLNVHPQWLFPYFLSWTLLFITGSWILIRRGRKKTGETLIAASWSRSKLAGALLIAFVLQWSTMTALNNTARLEAVADQTMALNRAQTILPSPPSNDEDATEIYNQVHKEMGEIPEWLWNAATDPAFDPQSEKAQNLLRDNKKSIALIKEAVKKPRLYHPLLVSYDFELQELTSFRNAARLLALEARTHVRNGEMTFALQNISDINKIAEHFNQTPILINIIVAGVIHIEAKKNLEILLAENPTRAKIKIPLPVKTHDHILQAYKDGMVFEQSFGDFSLSDWIIKSEPMNFSDLESDDMSYLWLVDNLLNHFSSSMYRIFLFHDERTASELYWKKYHEYIKEPYYQSGLDFKEWHDDLDKNLDLGLFMTLYSSAFGSYFERVTQQQTQFLLGRLGLATAAYHSDHGKYPSTLNTLVPKYITEIPIDPFSGEPLKMKTVDGGLILYGVGQDIKDDGGVAYDTETKQGDIAFYPGSAFKEHRLKPALEELQRQKEKRKNKEKEKE